MDNTFDESSNAGYEKYWAGVFTMDRENVLKTLMLDNLKGSSNKDLCKLFKFLSCFFCCLDHCDSDDDCKPEPCHCKYPCYYPYFPCEPNKDK